MIVPINVIEICKTLQAAGFEAWLVGGAVRDSLLNKEAHDWDIATNALPNKVRSLFKQVILTGLKHGTVTVIINNQQFEITTYRGEDNYTDGRRPDEITFLQTIEEDLARRDFTINSIAYNPLSNEFKDPYGGMVDLNNKIIRAVGDPKRRFNEDGLRILRAARFAATLEFNIELNTLLAIRTALSTYAKISLERVHDEWLKAMCARTPSIAFNIMNKQGILDVTVPEFVPMFGCAQNRHHKYDVWTHTMLTVDNCPQCDPILRVAALFHDIGKPIVKNIDEATNDATFYQHEVIGAELTGEILYRLKFSNENKERITHLVRHHYIRYQSDWSDPTIRRWVRRVCAEHVESLCALARADIIAKGLDIDYGLNLIDEFENRIHGLNKVSPIVTTPKLLAVNGKDIMDCLDIKSGPEVGVVLKNLMDIVTENPTFNTKEELLKIVSYLKKDNNASNS